MVENDLSNLSMKVDVGLREIIFIVIINVCWNITNDGNFGVQWMNDAIVSWLQNDGEDDFTKNIYSTFEHIIGDETDMFTWLRKTLDKGIIQFQEWKNEWKNPHKSEKNYNNYFKKNAKSIRGYVCPKRLNKQTCWMNVVVTGLSLCTNSSSTDYCRIRTDTAV